MASRVHSLAIEFKQYFVPPTGAGQLPGKVVFETGPSQLIYQIKLQIRADSITSITQKAGVHQFGFLSGLREAGLIEESVVSQILCQSHSGFSVWMGERIMPEDAPARLFLSRYIDRAPFG